MLLRFEFSEDLRLTGEAFLLHMKEEEAQIEKRMPLITVGMTGAAEPCKALVGAVEGYLQAVQAFREDFLDLGIEEIGRTQEFLYGLNGDDFGAAELDSWRDELNKCDEELESRHEEIADAVEMVCDQAPISEDCLDQFRNMVFNAYEIAESVTRSIELVIPGH